MIAFTIMPENFMHRADAVDILFHHAEVARLTVLIAAETPYSASARFMRKVLRYHETVLRKRPGK